jgi:signal transduction histidine kinase
MVLSGPLDLVVPEAMSADIVAVVREALANVGKHAHSTDTLVSVRAEDTRIVVDVTDNGVGLHDAHNRSGITNLAHRAATYGGEFSVDNRESSGTHLRWSAPIPEGGDKPS